MPALCLHGTIALMTQVISIKYHTIHGYLVHITAEINAMYGIRQFIGITYICTKIVKQICIVFQFYDFTTTLAYFGKE